MKSTLLLAAVVTAVSGGAPAVLRAQAAAVTFTKDIAPIVFEHCATCHRKGEAAPFPLLTYQDLKSHANQIAEVTQSRFMPPWLPEPGYGDFHGERRLTDEQIQTITRWVAAGAPEGDPRHLPEPPQFTPGWQLGEPDLVVTMPEPYTLPDSGLDVYRHFVIPVPVQETRWIRAMELRPGNARPIHHAFILIDPTRTSRRYAAEDAEPGFAGMDSRGAYAPAGQFISWQPGKMHRPGDEEITWRLNPGTDLVLQLHMQPTGKPETIQPSVGLYFADGPGSKQPQKMVLQSKDIDIPAGDANYVVQDEYRLPVDVDVLAVLPHAHYLATRMEAFARLPDGTVRWLLLIKQWDFNWQGDYQYEEPVFLPAGSLVTMRYTYDNSAANIRNPNQPPKRVTYGLNSTDEMAELWLQVLPRDPADLAYLQRDLGRYTLQRLMERSRELLEKDPRDVVARIDLGRVLLAFGRLGEAEAHFSFATELDAESAIAHYNLGHVYLRQGRLEEAERELQRAIELDPARIDAVHDLGLAYLKRQDPVRAEQYFRKAIELNPYDSVSQSNLAIALLQQKKIAEAIPHLEAAADLEPEDKDLRQRLEKARQVLAFESGDFGDLQQLESQATQGPQ